MIFHPSVEEMYGKNYNTYVTMETLGDELCGKSRPIHFRGVCTVVTKLFNILTPDKAFFGQKDAQQLAIIKRMVKDLNMNLEVVDGETMQKVEKIEDSVLVAMAVYIGNTRLIDNFIYECK